MGNGTPSYIKALLMPNPKKSQGRRVWSIDLESVWLPFFAATNTMGDTAIPHDALGCSLRLAYNKDGSVKFGNNGRPVIRVAKEISQHVSMVRENFVANLTDYASMVASEKKEAYNRTVKLAKTAGLPISQHDRIELDKAIQHQLEQAIAEAEAPTEAPTETKVKEAVTA